MISFEDLIQTVRSGKWIQFYSGSICYKFLASEKFVGNLNLFDSKSNEPVHLVLTKNRLSALDSTDSFSEDAQFILTDSRADFVQFLINPLSKSFDNADIPHSLKPLSPHLKVILKLIKSSKLLPSYLFCKTEFNAELPLIDIDKLNVQMSFSNIVLERVSEVRVPITQTNDALFIAFRPNDGGQEHIAIIIGDPSLVEIPLVRVHSECFTGDLFSSLRCDCGSQLKGAIEMMCNHHNGILIYLAQEGRGIGLVNKLRSYQLQDQGIDTVDANLALGFDVDERDYFVAAQILESLNINAIRLLTNNPEKVRALEDLGVKVIERVSHIFPSNPFNQMYMNTKKIKSGHFV